MSTNSVRTLVCGHRFTQWQQAASGGASLLVSRETKSSLGKSQLLYGIQNCEEEEAR